MAGLRAQSKVSLKIGDSPPLNDQSGKWSLTKGKKDPGGLPFKGAVHSPKLTWKPI